MQSFARGPVFVVTYLLCMLPTYVLPYMGSNASILRATARAVGSGDYVRPWT